MSNNHKIEYVTDYCSGELEDGQDNDLNSFLRDNPELAGEAELLARVWRDLESIDVASPDPELLERLGRSILERLAEGELIDEELDLAAGGTAPQGVRLDSIIPEEKE